MMCLKLQRGWSNLTVVKFQVSINSDRYIRDFDSALAVSDEDMKISCENYHEILSNREFASDRNSFCQANTVSSVLCAIDKDMVRESISKSKKERIHDH